MTVLSVYFGGRWQTLQERAQIEIENPSDESIIGFVPECNEDDAHEALEAATAAQKTWAALPAVERANTLFRLSSLVRDNADHLAQTLVMEQGKPLNQALGEVGAAVNFLNFAAEGARRIEGDIVPSDNANEEIWIRRVPRGVVVGLTAWNYPLALAARKLGPALVAGNTFVLLSHENTPLSGIELAKLAEQADIPPGVFSVLTGRGPVVGRALVESPLSNMVTMTGSSRAGREIYRSAADQMKFLSLELGGKAPFIVMEDADIDAAVEAAVTARYTNCGQICTCSERVYLHRTIADEFTEKFVTRSAALSIGDPMQNPDMGPKVSRVEADKVDAMVKRAIEAGAEPLLHGGKLTDGEYTKGHWMSPSVLAVTDNVAEIMQSEVFGPVVPILKIDSFDQALNYANQSEFGLSAYLWTKDISRMMRVSRELKFGEVYFNRENGEQVQGYHTGWGASGTGGEDGKYGHDSYMKKQSMYVRWSE